MKFILEIIKGVIEYMKDLKEKIKKLIESGEDPELVRKLEEVLAEPQEVEEAQDQPEFIPEEIPLPTEQFEVLRSIQREKLSIEHTMGVHYSEFHRRIDPLTKKITEILMQAQEERTRIISEFAPDGLAEEYVIAETKTEEGTTSLILRRAPTSDDPNQAESPED